MKPYPILLLLTAAVLPAYGGATDASGSAADISGSAQVTGSLLGVNLGTVNVGVTPINSAQGTAPDPYSATPTPLLTVDSDNDGLATLGLNVAADTVNSQSNVDLEEGIRNVSSTVRIASASANLGLDLGILGSVNILTLGVNSGTDLITSTSSVTWNGTANVPSSSSNLLTSNGTVTLSVLGLPLTIPGLAPGVESLIPVDVDLGALSVTGTISLTVDDFNTVSAVNTSFANASTLSLSANLSLTSGILTSLSVSTDIAINPTSVQLTSAPAPVPEPGAMGMLAASLGCLVLRRRR